MNSKSPTLLTSTDNLAAWSFPGILYGALCTSMAAAASLLGGVVQVSLASEMRWTEQIMLTALGTARLPEQFLRMLCWEEQLGKKKKNNQKSPNSFTICSLLGTTLSVIHSNLHWNHCWSLLPHHFPLKLRTDTRTARGPSSCCTKLLSLLCIRRLPSPSMGCVGAPCWDYLPWELCSLVLTGR